jgi:hypothetical protein|tara:strand:- start:16 stop:234 length:219 start_codon:yes stop_codon:yes gene_type:complete
MIRLSIRNGVQSLSKRCDTCGCFVENINVDDIITKPKWANSDTMTFYDSQGNEITRTEPPNSSCQCNDCSND